ncbi:polyadenylate-binding protein-interacting protein 6 isoform X3 [Brassica napus]|uniref:polyadenylate-binding protein-interacting protein 6 isoform X3 n=1 Tax=Brassica napus TaxID=3708 RepID=UPI00207919A4|nr:polyadenylate-binding protein-interacting protein 6 isoform X3 [Brassica napus]
MKPGGSGLNPNAAAYVPLYKREADSTKPAAATATHDVQHQPYGYGVQGKGSFPGSHMRDDDSEMEMEFLLASFSNLSDESICDVYLANNGDLDATIEMLTQHEFQLRMELGEEIGRGHFDYGCSPKLKKERFACSLVIGIYYYKPRG